MKNGRGFGWVTGIGAGAVAVVCCALGPAVVAGSVLAAAAGLVTGSGLIALLALAFVALVLAVVAHRRTRCRTGVVETSNDQVDATVAAVDGAPRDQPRGTVGS